MTDEFWKRKSLQQMSPGEWESLCDGCALCCLQKLEDEDTGEIYYTDIACKLLDIGSCRCRNYKQRLQIVKTCLVLSADQPEVYRWLPATCAYRRLSEGKELPLWHPLVSGDPETVHEAGISARGKAVSEEHSGQYSVLRQLSNDD